MNLIPSGKRGSSQTTPPPDRFLQFVRALGWIMALALFLVTMALVWRLASATVMPSTNPSVPTGATQAALIDKRADAPTHITPAAQPASGLKNGKPETSERPGSYGEAVAPKPPAAEEPKPAVADVISALSAAVAVMTLVLALGVPWFYDKIDAVREIGAEAKKTVEDVYHLQDKLLSLQDLQTGWIAAQSAVIRWLDSMGKPAASSAQLIGLYLQALQSEEDATRRDAFGFLLRQPWPEPLNLMGESVTTPLWRYQLACHRHHALYQHVPPERVWTQTNLWCLFWDPVEIKRFNSSDPPPLPTLAEGVPPLPA